MGCLRLGSLFANTMHTIMLAGNIRMEVLEMGRMGGIRAHN